MAYPPKSLYKTKQLAKPQQQKVQPAKKQPTQSIKPAKKQPQPKLRNIPPKNEWGSM